MILCECLFATFVGVVRNSQGKESSPYVETVPIDSPGRLRLKDHRLDSAPKSVRPQSSPVTALLPVFPGKLRGVSRCRQSSFNRVHRRRWFGCPSPRAGVTGFSFWLLEWWFRWQPARG
jgi:hypothetical protein